MASDPYSSVFREAALYNILRSLVGTESIDRFNASHHRSKCGQLVSSEAVYEYSLLTLTVLHLPCRVMRTTYTHS